MDLRATVTGLIRQAVENHELAGANVLAVKNGRELVYAEYGDADREAGQPVRRDTIFRLYSQTKPVTAAAAMLLIERGVLDTEDPAEKFLPGFRNQRVVTPEGLVPAERPVTVSDLLCMRAGLCYPDADRAGQFAAQVIDEDRELILKGGGMTTRELCDRLGRQPLAFQPGTQFRYSTCADVLGAVIEAADGRPYSDFLREEFFEPLGMKDTAFWVPPEKADRFARVYRRAEGAVEPWQGIHLAVGDYTHEPPFASGGAGLVSTLDDYAKFAAMLMNGGIFEGRRYLSRRTVEWMTEPQHRADGWIPGFGYGKLMRVCVDPGAAPGLARAGEYGWDGWLGTYFANIPDLGLTILLNQNTVDTGTGSLARKVRNVLIASA